MKTNNIVLLGLAFSFCVCLRAQSPEAATTYTDLGTITSDAKKVNEDSLDIMIGQMIMVGIGDYTSLTGDESILLEVQSGKIGGLVLYEKNLSKSGTADSLKNMLARFQTIAPISLFIGIDEEGGKVNRLKPKYGFPKTVSAQYLGQLNNPDSTFHYASQTATLLKNLGINMNYAPCLDVNVNPSNPVIGKLQRSYSENYGDVSKHAGEVVKAHDRNNIISVLKHFPGHGSSSTDTHKDMTDVSKGWSMPEVFPYGQLLDNGLAPALMSAHIVNEHLDPSRKPATLSIDIIQHFLRDIMHYDGVVMSDDMQMHAISEHYGLEEGVILGINAGLDVLMFANNVPGNQFVSATKLHEMIKKRVVSGDIPRARIKESYSRIMDLKRNYFIIN